VPGQRDVDAVGVGVDAGDDGRGHLPRLEVLQLAIDQVEHGTGVALVGVPVGPQRAAQPTHDDRGAQALADHVTDGDDHPPGRQDEHVVPVAPNGPGTGDVAHGRLEPGHVGELVGQKAPLHHQRRVPVGLGQRRLGGERDPIGHHLEQVGILVVEVASRHGAHMQHPQQLAADEQGHTEKGSDAPVAQERVDHIRFVDVLDRLWLPGRGHAPGEASAQGHAHTLVHLLLDPPGRGGHELPVGVVEEEDGRGVRRQDLADAIQQLDEEFLQGQLGEARIGHHLDVPQPLGDRPAPTPG
jgi:hypothetical protein